MQVASQIAGRGDLTNTIREVFAQVTRYPLEILDVDANLEEDLGIDSVKLGEIFSVLREKYDLPNAEEMEIPRERLTTISAISGVLYEYLSGGKTPVDSPREGAIDEDVDHPHLSPKAAPTVSLLKEESARLETRRGRKDAIDLPTTIDAIREVFAQVTRYPLEILDVDANLEEDLGIDSVKLGEIFSVLREKYDLPNAEEMEIPRERLTTISAISGVLYEYLGKRAGQEQRAYEQNWEDPQPLPTDADLANRAWQDSSVPNTSQATPSVLGWGPKPFAGKIAFITGSGRGIGRDIACYLADLGSTVIVNSFHSRNQGIENAEAINSAGGDAFHVWGSVANPEQLHRMFDEIEEKYGYLDFFISCASNGILAKLENVTVEHWEKAFRTNVVGLHQGALRAAELMKKRGGGKIITLSSPAAYGYVEYFGCMGAVKAAVESLTKSMAVELGPHNIQVNCVSPGPVYGKLLSKWPESERLIAEWEAATSYKRLCEPRDVSHFIAYLLSEPVKLFTGSVLVMDGGISARSF